MVPYRVVWWTNKYLCQIVFISDDLVIFYWVIAVCFKKNSSKTHPRRPSIMDETSHWPDILGKPLQVMFNTALHSFFFWCSNFLLSYDCCFSVKIAKKFIPGDHIQWRKSHWVGISGGILWCSDFRLSCGSFLSKSSSKVHCRKSNTKKQILQWPEILGKLSYR